MTTVTGRTAIIGVDSPDAVHVVTVDGHDHPARTLVRHDVPVWLAPAAEAQVLRCMECGRDASAIELYARTPVAGECPECAWELLSTTYAPAADDAEDAA